jgi:hypothetical protein
LAPLSYPPPQLLDLVPQPLRAAAPTPSIEGLCGEGYMAALRRGERATRPVIVLDICSSGDVAGEGGKAAGRPPVGNAAPFERSHERRVGLPVAAGGKVGRREGG